MKEMLLLGYNTALNLKPLQHIDSNTKMEDSEILRALVNYTSRELGKKIEGIDKPLKSKSTNAIGLSTLVMPMLLYVTSSGDNPKKEKHLVCNSEDWLKRIYTLDNSNNYDQEELDKLIDKQQKELNKVIPNISKQQLTGLMLSKGRTKTRAVSKRIPVSMTGSMQAFPLVYLWGYSLGLSRVAKTKLLKIVYRRLDNLERTHYFSTNREILESIYKDTSIASSLESLGDRALPNKLYNQNISPLITEGLFQVPDISLPKNSDFFTRKISLGSITSIEDVTDNKEELEYLENIVIVDLDNAINIFIRAMEKGINSEDEEEIRDIFGLDKDTPIEQAMIVKNGIETTKFRIKLHKYMLERQDIFINYDGLLYEHPQVDYSDADVMSNFESLIKTDSKLDDISL